MLVKLASFHSLKRSLNTAHKTQRDLCNTNSIRCTEWVLHKRSWYSMQIRRRHRGRQAVSHTELASPRLSKDGCLFVSPCAVCAYCIAHLPLMRTGSHVSSIICWRFLLVLLSEPSLSSTRESPAAPLLSEVHSTAQGAWCKAVMLIVSTMQTCDASCKHSAKL